MLCIKHEIKCFSCGICFSLVPFLSSETLILLVSIKDHNLWVDPTLEVCDFPTETNTLNMLRKWVRPEVQRSWFLVLTKRIASSGNEMDACTIYSLASNWFSIKHWSIITYSSLSLNKMWFYKCQINMHCILQCTDHSEAFILMRIYYLHVHFQWRHFCSAVHLIYDSPAPLSILGTSCWCNFHTVAVKSTVASKEKKTGIDTDFVVFFSLIHVSFPVGIRLELRIAKGIQTILSMLQSEMTGSVHSSSQTSAHKDGLLPLQL